MEICVELGCMDLKDDTSVFVELCHGFELCYLMVILFLIYLGLFDLIDCIFMCMLFASAPCTVICSA
jgi:hypothetical protein